MKIGVLGAGQLAMMLAQAGQKLGLSFKFWDTDLRLPIESLGELQIAPFNSQPAFDTFIKDLDRVIFEFENIPAGLLRELEKRLPVSPQPIVLETSQDRLLEKNFLARHIPTVPFLKVNSDEELQVAVSEIGFPAILKTRRLGYDGKGQVTLRADSDLKDAWGRLGAVPCILEKMISFERELSIIAARCASGKVVFYPLCENRHEGGILRRSIAPALNLTDEVWKQATSAMSAIMRDWQYVGVGTLELFQTAGGKLLANEFAPRVHNSGHWTIEGASVSQFENHLRAVAFDEVINPEVGGVWEMLNYIGELPKEAPDGFFHPYGKVEKPNRKVGHLTRRLS